MDPAAAAVNGNGGKDLCAGQDLWGLGVGASLIASLAYTSGFLLQKKAHIQEENKAPHARARSFAGLICSSRWLIGLACVVLVSVPFDFVAFTLAGEALAAPLKGVAIIMNQVMAPWMLGESLQFWDYVSTLLVVIGCTITTIFGPHICQSYSVKELFELFKGVPFIICESVLSTMAILAVLVVWRRQFRVDYRWVNTLADNFECPFLAFFAGALGVQVNILMKCVGGMVQDDVVNHTDNYTQYFFWLSLFIGFVFVLSQLSIINQGLAVFEAVKFMPMMVVIFIVGCSVVGGVYYREFTTFKITEWVMFPIGCLIILAGVLLLTLTEDKAKRLYSMDSMDTYYAEDGAYDEIDDHFNQRHNAMANQRRAVLGSGRLSLQNNHSLAAPNDERLLSPDSTRSNPGPIL